MNRLFALLTLLPTIFFSCAGQTKNVEEKEPIIFSDPYAMPYYPGGDMEMMQFIGKNLQYPNTEACVQGRVVLRFLITESGELDSLKVIRSLHPDYDKEAMRVVKLMPKWTPGTQNGKVVPIGFTLPILFRPKEANLPETYPRMIYTILDTMPKYPNGIQEMVKFINNEVMNRFPINGQHYPSGRIAAKFIVKKEGNITDIKLHRNLSHTQDSIAIDIIRAMPKWNPGIKNGKPVDCYYTIPIPFPHQ